MMSRLIGLLTNLAAAKALDSGAQTTYNQHHLSILTFIHEETLSEVISVG